LIIQANYPVLCQHFVSGSHLIQQHTPLSPFCYIILHRAVKIPEIPVKKYAVQCKPDAGWQKSEHFLIAILAWVVQDLRSIKAKDSLLSWDVCEVDFFPCHAQSV
jgi:hypothetical protein